MISVIWEQTYTTSFTLIGVNLNIHLSYIGATLDNADDPVGIWYLTARFYGLHLGRERN